jgi:hypothetical protein
MNDFNYLPFNKNFGYKSPINDDICRTGTVKDDCISSFLNAVLCGCSVKFNTLRNDDEKIEKIKEFKENIVKQFNEQFKNYLSELKDKFFENLEIVFDFINADAEENDKNNYSFASEIKSELELYKIIIELITLDDYTKIMKKVMRNCKDNKFETFRKNIIDETIKFIDYEDILEDVEDERINYIKKSVCYFIDLVLDDINIEEPQIPDVVTPEIIISASKSFDNCDIYFVDWDTKLPKLIDGYKHSGNDKSIILLTFNNNTHFEIIGKTVSVDSDKKHKIKREFMPFDDIIKSINFYLDKKDKEIK